MERKDGSLISVDGGTRPAGLTRLALRAMILSSLFLFPRLGASLVTKGNSNSLAGGSRGCARCSVASSSFAGNGGLPSGANDSTVASVAIVGGGLGTFCCDNLGTV